MEAAELGDGIGQGGLFTRDFLRVGITETPDWPSVSDADIDAFCDDLKKIFDPFPDASNPNESQTEDDLIWPVLSCMGWHHFLRQQNLSSKGRENVPDGLLFADEAGKTNANALPEEWRRYEFGVAIVESKRWNRLLDRRDKGKTDVGVPSTQMLRYLRRVEDLTAGGGR